MPDSRSEILRKLKLDTAVSDHRPVMVQPAFVKQCDDIVQLFTQKLEAVQTSVEVVSSAEQTGSSIVRFLQSHQIPLEVGVVPACEEMDLNPDQGLHYYPCEYFAECKTVLTKAAFGIAETGTLVLPSSVRRPTLANFLPDNCIVVIYQQDIVSYLEEGLLKIQNREAGMPRALNLISGPSKTADIEQTLVYGAHGPIQLHVIIIR